MKKNILIQKALLLFFTSLIVASCSKENLEPILADDIPVEDLETVEQARQYMDGTYALMVDYRYWGRNIIIAGEARADNVFANANSGRFLDVAQMNLLPQSGTVAEIMQYAYGSLANVNLLIAAEGIEGDPEVINQIKGEAYAIRALVHFDLLRVYGQQFVSGQGGNNALGVSYVTGFKDEDLYVARSTVSETKNKIYADLDKALSLLTPGQNDPNKITITTFAAQAIKARVATYFQEYDIARTACEAIIGNFNLTTADNYVDYWAQKTVPPASIFELEQTPSTSNSINGIANIYRGASYGDIEVLDNFPTDAEFGPNDVRNSPEMISEDRNGRLRNMGKYPTLGSFDDNIKVIRYAEVVLNYAEALLETNPDLSLQYLNSIPENRNGTTYSVSNMTNILKERRKELAFEGFRFDDLARTGRDIPVIDPANQTHGGPEYGSTNYAFPMPRQEIDNNPLSKQNAGYN
ncbi:RagB/SusD family nutrient uptake outer membrane protein [Marixanthomonas spongiae]|uniref:RagB/SusD family nutrient uptake outer membrane protein n=1 Tax=Marixanthomonas spongiae TaxID=2174845 RepID=A0A2U0HWY5_9FLAO|nr:RagB/SusD family nutrient uptake outer membrane protein [Marixanthomonas spongiae]PVW13348.1 RagB/SusD family nutrient uptake outer membrane protein [Marixanthomonas spongiae]